MARSVRLWVERMLTSGRLGRRRGFGSRSRRHRARWPGVALGSVGVLIGVGLLVAVAHVHGDSPNDSSGFPDAELATLSEPAVAAAASLLALVLIAWSVRRLLLEYLGWRPGPIVVKTFVAPEEITAAVRPHSPEDVWVLFRIVPLDQAYLNGQRRRRDYTGD